MIKMSRELMGSSFEIITTEAENIEQIVAQALDSAERVEQQISHFEMDSDISIINRYAFESAVPVSPHIFNYLLKMRSWSALTENGFDPTVGKLIKEWGFFQRGIQHAEGLHKPDLSRARQIAEQTGWKNVDLNEENSSIRFKSLEVELHLGAVGKGIAVEAAGEFLHFNGAASFLISSGGSSCYAFGSPAEMEGWKIGLEHPLTPGRCIGSVVMHDCALSVSSSRGQTQSDGNKVYGHILDPRTGKSLESTDSVYVFSDNAAYSEALSTAFLVNGASWTGAYLRKHPEVGCVLYQAELNRLFTLNILRFEAAEDVSQMAIWPEEQR